MKYFQSFNSFVKKTEEPVLAEDNAFLAARAKAINEDKFDGIADLTKALHFETDSKKAEEMKIELGKRQGEVTRRKQIEGGEYSLRRFRKEIKYGDGKDLGVFLPGSYAAATSSLGDGPHTKRAPKVRWNQKKYAKWLEDVASNDGWKNAFDMAQNAKHEPGLLDWAKKQFRGEDVMQRIQWDIEAFAESVVTEKTSFSQMKKDSKTKEYKEISNALRDDTEEVSDIWDMLDPKMFKFTESEFEDIFHEWWNTQYYDSLEDFCRNGSFEDAHSLYLHLLPHVAESVVTEARFVKDFNRDVLDAKTKDEVLKLYPNAEFFLGKSDHFFGELDDNLFFKAYYTKGQKEFEIKSIYSEKNKNYVHLYNESVVNEKSKFKKRATIFSTVHSDDFDGDVYDITNDVDGSEIYKDTEFKILSIDKDEVILYDKEGDIEYSIDPDDLQYFTESVVNEAKGGQIFPGDYVKTQYGDIYMRVDGKVGKHDAYVRVIRGKVHKRKTALHHTMKLTVVNKDGLEESVTEANTFTDKWEREEAEFKRIIASPDKRVYDLVDYVQFSTGGMTEKDWEKFMYGRYKKNLQSTDSKTKEKMYNVIQKMVLESEMISESATEMLAKEIQDAEYYIAHGDGSTIEARSTKKTWDDGVPVLKYIARGKKQMVKTPKGSFELVVDEKYGWYYWENKGTWYGANIEYGATPPFEF